MAISVKRPEGIVELCTDLALRGEWEAASDRLTQVQKNESDQRLGNAAVVEAARGVQELERRMAASTLLFRMRSMNRKQWQELGAEHPPREGNPQDAALGVNVATFFDAAAKLSIVSVNDKATEAVVEFDAAAEWDELTEQLTDGQWQAFADEILRLNRSVVDAPFSRTASLLTRPSEEN